MGPRVRPLLAGSALLTAACLLASCGSPRAPSAAPKTTTTSSTTTTTSPPPTTTMPQGVAVPNVVGMKIELARFYLQTAGFATVPFDAACNKGTLASQSVVASLSVPGKPPYVTVGAQPLAPGTLLSKGARVGVTWSGCYPEGTQVPLVIGRTFPSAVHLLHLAGLNWACYSVGTTTSTTSTITTTTTTTTTHPTTTTLRSATTTTSAGPSTSTNAPTTPTSGPKPPPSVLSQGVKAGAVVHAGSVVDLFMLHCPQ